MSSTQRWRKKKLAEGLVEVRVMVPLAERETLIAVAESLRPMPVNIGTEIVEPSTPDRPPSDRFLAFAENLALTVGVEIPPPIKRSNNRLCGWCQRNKNAWSWADQRAEEKRLEKIARLKAELEKLT